MVFPLHFLGPVADFWFFRPERLFSMATCPVLHSIDWAKAVTEKGNTLCIISSSKCHLPSRIFLLLFALKSLWVVVFLHFILSV